MIKRTNQADWSVPWWLEKYYPKFSTLPLYSIGPLGFRELDRGRLLKQHILDRVKSRLHMAFFGGTALIVPVIAMTLIPTLTGNLITASVSTALFAMIMVIFSTDASGKDVLAATAAYAAVMVVFIGTSLQAYV